MQKVIETIEYLTQELFKRAREVKHGNVAINLAIHNGRITAITNTTTLSIKDYINEEIALSDHSQKVE